MTFDADLAGGLADLYGHAGVAAVFTPAGVDPPTVSLNVIIEYSVEWEPQAQLQIADDHTVIHYQRADIDRRVVRGETFAVGGSVYTVRSMASYPDAFSDIEGRAVVVKS